jgi:8-oxo-dGTP pyrophosphatase MutT (NUDIX family)
MECYDNSMITEATASPIPAATLIVVRERGRAPEVLLLKRSAQARFMPNAYVFPGGVLDSADAAPANCSLCPAFSDAEASERLNVPRDGLRYFIAAMRECFEESGILHAVDDTGTLVDFSSRPQKELHDMRLQLSTGRGDLASLCRGQRWRLAPEHLCFFSHWITPPRTHRRFDTRFFIAAAPPCQTASLASTEMSELAWRTPAEALAQHADGELLLMLPTHAVLREMAEFGDLGSLLEFARRRTAITAITPDVPPN